MDEKATVRPATGADAAAIAEIYNESILAATATMVDRPQTAADITDQMERFSAREGYLVLERKGRVLGWGVIKLYSPRAGYNRCAETSVFVRANELRRGYGSQLKTEMIERCRTCGYHHLIARVWADNEASLACNRRFGYELVGIQKEIGYMGGKWRDVAVLQLVLDDVGPEVAEPLLS